MWGVGKKRGIYRLTENQKWEKVHGTLVEISAGQAGVWGVNIKNEVYYRKGTYGGALRFVEFAGSIVFLSVKDSHLTFILFHVGSSSPGFYLLILLDLFLVFIWL